ncbi:MAG: M14 family metallopeptidase [Gemmatimonadota bacterium]
MKILGIRGRGAAWLWSSLLAILGLPAPLPGQTASYLDHDGLTREIRSVVNASPMASMESLGTSREGREIWMVRVAEEGSDAEEAPAVLVVGNLSGDHLLGSALALETIRYLVGGEAELDGRVVYVVPRLNPDGAEAMFAAVKRDVRRNVLPFDDDNDGRVDEDGPEDLNGDGMITVMRVPDAQGAYVADPEDDRLMKLADAAEGEAGMYALYWEGRDHDGDGFVAEDGPGGVDLDRNFQHAYPYWEPDAGAHMVSEPEARALLDFVIGRRNIAAILTFGHSDNLVTPPDGRGNLADAVALSLPGFADASNADVFDVGVFRTQGGGGFRGFGGGGGGLQLRGAQVGRDNDPSSGRRPSTTVHRDDLEYFTAISDAYREITGITELALRRAAEGAFFQYGYFQFGVPSFSTPGWGLPRAEPDEGDVAAPPRGQGARTGGAGGGGADARILNAFEAAGLDAFVPWTGYRHPDLGDVEIGGFVPYAVTNPPATDLPELGEKHGRFVAHLVSLLPRVRIADTEVTNHGGGVFTVSVEVANEGFLPTSLQHGQVSRSVQPTTVQIQVPPEAVLTGDPKTSRIPGLDGSGHRERFTWVVQAREGSTVEIRVRAQKAGSDAATVTLR